MCDVDEVGMSNGPSVRAFDAEMFRVLDCGDIGMGLTESLAMTPAARVSGFYMARPNAAYFNVGKIGDDQLADWAKRNALDAALARRALAPLLQRLTS
jgi:5-methyltetrahydrofolate--homocysteine methyltransferase